MTNNLNQSPQISIPSGHVVRKKTIWRIVIFVALVTALAFVAPLLGGSPSKLGFGFILWGVAPMLVAILMRTVTRDWFDVGFKPAIRKNILWYIISILAFPVIMLLTLLVGEMISVSTISGFSMMPYINTVLPAFAFFFIFAIFEEFGWRGYLAPKLASIGINSYLAAVIVGVVWASWHLPFITDLTWVYSSESLLTFIPRLFVGAIAFSLLYGEIRILAGTFWPAVMLHAVSNSFGHPLAAEYIKIVTGKEYLGSIGFDGVFMIVFFGLLGIVFNRWRIRKNSLSKSF